MDSRIENGISDLDTALNVLEMAGVINSPDYWRNQAQAENAQYLLQLLINLANRALDPLHRIVWAEARGEDEKGQILAANVILNRHRNPRFQDGIYNVIHANGVNSQGVRTWQFTPVAPRADGRPSIYEEATPFPANKRAVEKALDGADYSQGALFFHAISHLTADTWHERALTKLFDHGNHRFYG